ncbi:MAG: extracellular solute-binding protein [Oscillospiraceae bacterium]|nr:extracellular solute-binding protein [Oscillospiraceae bacterium]
MKKILAFILAAIMMLTLCACGGGNGTGEGSGAPVQASNIDNEKYQYPLTKDVTLKILVPSSSSWPVRDDWKVWEYMSEGANVTLDIMGVPAEEVGTKLPLMMSDPTEIPDILAGSMNSGYDKYADQGVVALDDLEAYMPNYNAWLDSLTDDEYAVAVTNRKEANGKIYYTPGSGREGRTRMRAWLYREDIFKKHNLKVPETFDDLYKVCKKLKTLYPDSYPFCTRSEYLFDIPGSSFDKWWEHDVYYDYDDGEWRWGATEDTAKEVIEFYKKMIAEGLMPADTITLDNTKWEEYILTGRGFILPHLQLRIDYFNSRAQATNPEYKITAMKPPVANEEKGAPMVDRGDLEMIGYAIGQTDSEESIANSAKFIDWLYTDEAVELVSWGKEGETFEWVNKEEGQRRYITNENNDQANTMYGFQLYGTFARLDPTAAQALQSETTLECEDIVIEGTLPYHNPAMWVAFNEDEQVIIDEKLQAIQNYTKEMMTKFLLGQESMSKYDEFVETLKSMGVQDVLDVYEAAYERVQ